MIENKNGLIVDKKSQLRFPFFGDFVIGDIDIESSAAHKDLSVIDIKDIEKVINAPNKVSEYNEYRKRAAERIYNSEYVPFYVLRFKQLNTKKSFVEVVAKHSFPDLKNDEEVVNHMTRKLSQFKSLVEKYKDTISTKYKDLGISVSEYKKLLADISDAKYDSIGSKIFAKLKAHEKEWKRDYGADFRKFGGGLVFVDYSQNIWDLTNVVESTYNMSCTNDVVVLVHGTNISTKHNLNEDEQKLAEKIKKLIGDKKPSKETEDEIYDKLTQSEKDMLKKYGAKRLIKYYDLQTTSWEDRYYSQFGLFKYFIDRFGNRASAWGFWEPLKTTFGTYRDVNEFLRECLKRGLKTIKIMACNPGHYEIADDIHLLMKDNPDIKINYQMYSVLIEGSQYYTNLMLPIIESFNFK